VMSWAELVMMIEGFPLLISNEENDIQNSIDFNITGLEVLVSIPFKHHCLRGVQRILSVSSSMILEEENTEFVRIPRKEYEHMQQTIVMLQQELANLKRALIGSKSERHIGEDPSQLALNLEFDQITTEEEKKEEISYSRTKPVKKGHARESIPAHLPRQTGSHDAAQRAAIIYSLLGTCKMNGVNPWQWLNHVLTVIPDWKANRLEELLPLATWEEKELSKSIIEIFNFSRRSRPKAYTNSTSSSCNEA